MKRLVISLLAIVFAFPPLLLAQEGPTLRITFTGLCLFIPSSNGAIRVVLPNLLNQSHLAYIRVLDDAFYQEHTTFGKSEPFECEKQSYRFLPLVADGLMLDQARVAMSEIADTETLAQIIHLGPYAEGASLHQDFSMDKPVPGKVAAQIDIVAGRLKMWGTRDTKETLYWNMRPDDAAGRLDNKKNVCAAQGLAVEVPLRPVSNKRVDLVSTFGNRRLALKAENGKTVEITIGNSHFDDLICPKKGLPAKDHHFALLYNMLTKQPGKPAIPHYTGVKCSGTKGDYGTRTYGGSNCMSGQWP